MLLPIGSFPKVALNNQEAPMDSVDPSSTIALIFVYSVGIFSRGKKNGDTLTFTRGGVELARTIHHTTHASKTE